MQRNSGTSLSEQAPPPISGASQSGPATNTQNSEYYGTAELAGTEITPQGQFGFGIKMSPASPSPSTAKPGANRIDNVSPVSAHSNMYSPPPVAELGSHQGVPLVPVLPELGGGQAHGQHGYNSSIPTHGGLVCEVPGASYHQQSQETYALSPLVPPPTVFPSGKPYTSLHECGTGYSYGQQLHQGYTAPHHSQGGFQSYSNQPPIQAPGGYAAPPPVELGAYHHQQQEFLAELSVDGSRKMSKT